ncbi:3-oxoacyl-[acyl-carrier-protein] reductase /acetoacetyl-CoA reductase [Anaerovirgula multivorans]|uniref:3-oxoacyl-[acyl-carrier-protein] reductase /acetoacetyl-CoA reductase n=1 Tax=Anaerovirgula multivorans TaxID=312168 RepID=A0A239J6A2_9FIRM|nr:3-oxoacyl-ACP reductase family protein [Anaerovirgula multivorans]SNT01421.1 3-oxoacyl-[acyl-carrier-protein] reductase /acetoacetyl-CoA reductase [Anaerovirgula multivorans]
MKLRNKVAIVTGGNRGIGAGIVEELVQEGAKLAIFYKSNHTAAEKIRKKLDRLNAEYRFYLVDITDYSQVETNIQRVIEHYGQIDILVNNAGTIRDNLFPKMTLDDWEIVMKTNLMGVFNCTRCTLPYMLAQGSGRIINISSILAFFGNVGQTNYCAAKAGIIGLTRAVATEVADRGICVNAVAPGATATEMFEQVPEKIAEHFLKCIPMGRIGEVKDVVNLVLFLASKDADYINGQIIAVDGGLTLRGF